MINIFVCVHVSVCLVLVEVVRDTINDKTKEMKKDEFLEINCNPKISRSKRQHNNEALHDDKETTIDW